MVIYVSTLFCMGLVRNYLIMRGSTFICSENLCLLGVESSWLIIYELNQVYGWQSMNTVLRFTSKIYMYPAEIWYFTTQRWNWMVSGFIQWVWLIQKTSPISFSNVLFLKLHNALFIWMIFRLYKHHEWNWNMTRCPDYRHFFVQGQEPKAGKSLV